VGEVETISPEAFGKTEQKKPGQSVNALLSGLSGALFVLQDQQSTYLLNCVFK
jgi:hypothetical protein